MFDPERAEIRFGCGLSPRHAPVVSVQAMLDRHFVLEEACGIGAEASGDATRLDDAKARSGRQKKINKEHKNKDCEIP